MINIQPKVYCRKNLAAQEVFQAIPWEVNKPLPSHLLTKADYTRWIADGTTDHLFFNLIETEISTQAYAETNQAHRIYGFVADFDSPGTTDDDFERMLQRCSPMYRPFAWNRTFSGGARVVWLFESPIFYYSPRLWKRFIHHMKSEVKITAMLPGYDVKSEQLGRYYTAGGDWRLHPLKPVISNAALQMWVMAATRPEDFAHDIEIPMEKVEAEVLAKFPGRWEGDFKEGARGCRFWDPTADNPTAAIVRKTGMQCFTGTEQFMSWERIFGRPFVQQYLQSRIGAALDSTWYDGQYFWRTIIDNTWDAMNIDTTRRHLKVRWGLKSDVPKGANQSEIDECLHQLETVNRVTGAYPYPFNQTPHVYYGGQRFLNIATTKMMEPAPEPQEWGVNFPWMANFLEKLFKTEQGLPVFLDWLTVWLRSLRARDPSRGQALYLAGGPGSGKTLLSTKLIGLMVGGHAEATSYVMGASPFNDTLFDKALWTIDDAVPSGNPGAMKRYSAVVKAIVANGTLRYEKKYGTARDIHTRGRLIVTLNKDPESLDMLPDIGTTLIDKVIFLETTDEKAVMPAASEAERDEFWKRELPYFLRFVLDREPVSKRDDRFGIVAHQDSAILAAAEDQSPVHQIRDAIDEWRTEFVKNHADLNGKQWKGTCGALLVSIRGNCGSAAAVIGGRDARWVGRFMARIVAHNMCDWLSIEQPQKSYVNYIVQLPLLSPSELVDSK